jgi:hypothetical protein
MIVEADSSDNLDVPRHGQCRCYSAGSGAVHAGFVPAGSGPCQLTGSESQHRIGQIWWPPLGNSPVPPAG